MNYVIKGFVHRNDEIENNKDLFPSFLTSKETSDGIMEKKSRGIISVYCPENTAFISVN